MDAVNPLAAVSLPTAPGSTSIPLQAGQVMQALVLELIESDVFRIQLPQGVVDVRADVPLTPGSTVTLAANPTSARLDILAPAAAVPPPARGVVAPAIAIADVAGPAQVARQPIGEAVILNRVAPADVGRVQPSPEMRAPPPLTPEAVPPPARALAEAVRSAAARQGGLAALFADAEHGAAAPSLPAPVRAAVAQLLAFRLPLDTTLTATDIKQAFTQSGVLLEPQLAAAGRANAAPAPMPAAAPTPASAPSSASASLSPSASLSTSGPAPMPDLKAALLVLRQVVRAAAGDGPQSMAPSTPGSPSPVPPGLTTPQALARLTAGGLLDPLEPMPVVAAPPLSPQEAEQAAKVLAAALSRTAPQEPAAPNPPLPYRGGPLAPQAPMLAALATDTPHAAIEKLAVDADAAIARTTLLQAASLPDNSSAGGVRDSGPRWTFEVPFATPHGTAIVPFEIARDGRSGPAEAQAVAWRVRFSLDVEPMGPVHALVTLVGERASVTLWAERATTASSLNDQAPMLGEALRAAELEPSELTFRVGAPRIATAAAPGRFMDRAS